MLFGDSAGGQNPYGTTPFGIQYAQSHPFSAGGGFANAAHQTPFNIFGSYLTPPTVDTSAASNPYNVDPQAFVEKMLAPLRAQLAGQSAAQSASAKAAIKRTLIQGGFTFDPKADIRRGIGYAIPGVMNKQTVQAIKEANAAGLTQNFMINQANDDANRNIVNTLAARGILRGGATGYQLGRQNTAYTQAQYGSRQKILDTIAGIWNGYLQAENQRQQMLAQNAMSAAGAAG